MPGSADSTAIEQDLIVRVAGSGQRPAALVSDKSFDSVDDLARSRLK